MNIGDVFYEKHTVEALSVRTGEPSMTKCEKVNAIEIFDGMTNGDVIRAVFPNIDIYNDGMDIRVCVWISGKYVNYFYPITWWDAPYKKRGGRMTDKEAIDYVKNVIENSEKVFFAGQPVNEVKLYTTDKGLEMLKRVVELAEGKKPTETAYWVNGRCNHCGWDAPKRSMPEMGGYSIEVPDLTDWCPHCGYKMEKE